MTFVFDRGIVVEELMLRCYVVVIVVIVVVVVAGAFALLPGFLLEHSCVQSLVKCARMKLHIYIGCQHLKHVM